MVNEKRKYKRFSATAFLKRPIYLIPCPPFFGKPIKGKMIDLSGGGIALLISEIIPVKTKLRLGLRFPDSSVLDAIIQVKRLMPKDGKYLIGMEFLSIAEEMRSKIIRMSTDYIDCESRIQEKAPDVCREGCAFYSMCAKPQRSGAAFDIDIALELAFKMLEESPLVPTSQAIS